MSYYQDYLNGMNGAFAKTSIKLNGATLAMDEGLATFAEKIESVRTAGGLIFFCGNGASCTMAEHMSHDFFQNALVNTQTCAETSHITAISNDIDYEHVFAYRINRILTERDMLLTISSSGNSPNVINAIETATRKGTFVTTFSGKDEENRSRAMGNLSFYVPLATYGMVESAHAVLLHMCLDYYLDTYMKGRH